MVWYLSFQKGETKMEKTSRLPRPLVIRAEIFGFAFLLALLAGLFAGCGGDPAQDGVTDSGTLAKPGTCVVPGVGQTFTPPGTTVRYFTTSDVVTCNNLLVCTAFPGCSTGYEGHSCLEIASNSTKVPLTQAQPCCVAVKADASKPGYVNFVNLICPGSRFVSSENALCSASGSFLGWICYLSVN